MATDKSCVYCLEIKDSGMYKMGKCQDVTGKSEKWYIRHAIFNDLNDPRTYIHHISEENAEKIALEKYDSEEVDNG